MQHGLEVKFHPIEHDKLRSLEELVFKLDVTKDSMHYVIVKNIPEFVMFRHIVSDSIDWMERVFPAVPVDLIDAPQYTVALKLWITEFLHDGPKLTAEVLYAMLTFFRVSENLGMYLCLHACIYVYICMYICICVLNKNILMQRMLRM